MSRQLSTRRSRWPTPYAIGAAFSQVIYSIFKYGYDDPARMMVGVGLAIFYMLVAILSLLANRLPDGRE
jgi:hypothetical protein